MPEKKREVVHFSGPTPGPNLYCDGRARTNLGVVYLIAYLRGVVSVSEDEVVYDLSVRDGSGVEHAREQIAEWISALKLIDDFLLYPGKSSNTVVRDLSHLTLTVVRKLNHLT